MNFNVNQDVQDKAKKILESASDKAEGITQAFEMLLEAHNEELIKQLQADNESIKSNAELAAKLGYRSLNSEETKFYEKLKNGAKQAINFTQEDIFPNTIIDNTLADVKKASQTLKLVNMAPAGVKKWLSSSKTGAAAWGGLTDELTSKLTATFEIMDIEVSKLHVILIVPKAVRELSLPVVDKYLTAILAEALHDGLVSGYLEGDGKTGPIGITRQIATVNDDKTHKLKTVDNTITDFSAKTLSKTLSTLSKEGIRTVSKLYLIANPTDVFKYVNPALFYFNGNALVSTASIDIEVIQEPMMPAGKAILTIADEYTLGMSAFGIQEFKEVKAIEDCDVLIGKIYGNGRAADDKTAVVFDVTKLEEYIPTVKTIQTIETPAA